MATLEQEQQVRSELMTELESLRSINASMLIRDTELGPKLNFEDGAVFFSRTLRLFHSLHDSDLQDVPSQKLNELRDVAKTTVQQIKQVQEFSLDKHPGTPMQVRQQFIDVIRDNYDSVFNVVAPVIAFSVRKGTDFERLEEQAKAVLQRIETTASGNEKVLTDARNNAEQVVAEVRRIAQEAGVSQHAIHFKQEADRHEVAAKTWLTATAWLGGITFLFGVTMLILFFTNLMTLTPQQSLQLAISKVVVFSVMLSAAIWVGKTYRAHRHNAVVNRHRQNALSTFQAFAKAASDEATKNAVLLQATQCIFAPQQTGYVSGEADGPAVPQVFEIFRNLSKAG